MGFCADKVLEELLCAGLTASVCEFYVQPPSPTLTHTQCSWSGAAHAWCPRQTTEVERREAADAPCTASPLDDVTVL